MSHSESLPKGGIPLSVVERTKRQELFGMNPTPVISIPASSAAEAASFPREEVLKFNVNRNGLVLRKLLSGAAFLLVSLMLALLVYDSNLLPKPLGLPGAHWSVTPLIMLMSLFIIIIMYNDSRTVVTWEMYVVTAVLAAVFMFLKEETLADAFLPVALLLLAAFITRKSRTARTARWAKLKSILKEHELVEMEVVAHAWRTTAGIAPQSSLLLTLASPQHEGLRWNVQIRLVPTSQIDTAPETGSKVLAFICPSDPQVLVARPVLSS